MLLLGNPNASNITVIQPERVEEKGKVKDLPIGVKTIREATRSLGLSQGAGGGRVLIVDDAHRLSEGAQNAFLKTLEDPFPETTIFLVTHEEGAILPTLVSRCERVSFSLISESVLSKNFPDIPKILHRLGRPGLVVSFRENREAFDEHLRRLETLLSFETLPFSERASCAEALSNDMPSAERLLSWWIGALAQSISSTENILERRRVLQLLHVVSVTLRDLRRFPGSTRLTLEQLFLFRKSVSPLFVQTISVV
jgi:hypothetical protein